MSTRGKLLIPVVAITALLVWFNRDLMLSRAAILLVANSDPETVDVIAALRGDDAAFSRARQGAALFKSGHAPRMYVSSALDDLSSKTLEADGFAIPSQVQLISMLYQQRGVPCQSILIDQSPPGGGTRGEIRRIHRMMEMYRLRSVLIVTSWYHTARSERLARSEFRAGEIKFRVLQAEDVAPVDSWWRDRYLALSVLTEWAKTFIDFVGGVRFANDAADSDRQPNISHSCPATHQESR